VITRADVADRATGWGLRHEVVERDYVLGWLLAGIGRHPELAGQWVFKGGIRLKKCYFETYRFSEDLDFTLLPGAEYDAASLRVRLAEVASLATQLSGIIFPAQSIDVREREDRLGRQTFEGRLGYRGPLAIPSVPRVLFDLTAHESLLDGVERRPVHHPYPDLPTMPVVVCAYSLEELLSEKLRAHVEWTRPRDLYDVVHVLTNALGELDQANVRRIFARKCRAKQFEAPTPARIIEIASADPELASEWPNMLGHQLPELAPLAVFLERLELLRDFD
jgi:predicted nucleotidyltransferase component of viral defense system